MTIMSSRFMVSLELCLREVEHGYIRAKNGQGSRLLAAAACQAKNGFFRYIDIDVKRHTQPLSCRSLIKVQPGPRKKNAVSGKCLPPFAVVLDRTLVRHRRYMQLH